jgi:CheY-like chemotaxis protein
MKILIVEDQKYPLEALEFAVGKVMPRHFEGFTKNDYDVARCYSKAEEQVGKANYDMILLDNRMPYEDQGDLEDKDFSRFSANLENTGYRLIPLIKSKNPKTTVIGTSSMSKGELRGLPAPDFTMRKMWGEAEEDLETILKQLKGANK